MLQDVMKEKQQRGFTLIELMFTIVVLAVLLGIGVPNFREFIMNSRMTSAANDLLGDLALARSEAIKRRTPVVLCGTNGTALTTCLASGTSFPAWYVFVDDNGDGIRQDPDEEVLRVHDKVAQGVTGTITGATPSVAYLPNGFKTSASATQVLFCDGRGNGLTIGNVPAARAVVIGPSGRAGVSRPANACS